MEPNVLDKKKLNNYIVSMRNDVRRSIVHTIHCMTRQAKLLREKNGTEEQKAKNIKKADRFIHEVMVIKALNKDDVSKFGLTTAQDLQQLQANMKAPLKDRAKARLCLHKFIAAEIKEFKEKYHISEAEVLKILRRKKKKLKKIKPSIDKKDISNIEVEGDKNNKKKHKTFEGSDLESESGEENECSEDIEESESDEESAYSEEEEEEIQSETEREENLQDYDSASDNYDENKNGKKVYNKKNVTASIKSKVVDKKSVKIDLKDSYIKREKSNTLKNNTDEYFMSNSIKQEKNVPEFTDLDANNITLENKPKTLKDPKETKAVDPFFMTIENKEYVTSQVLENSTDEGNISKNKLNLDFEGGNSGRFHSIKDYGLERRQFKVNGKSSFANDRHMEKYGFFAKANGVGDGFKNRSEGLRDGFKNRRERRLSLHKNIDSRKQNREVPCFNNRSNDRVVQRAVNPKPIEKLHPSWEAKKKLINIVEFQGKKTKFDV